MKKRWRYWWHQAFGCPSWAIEEQEAKVGDSSRVALRSCLQCGHCSWSWTERWVHDLLTPMED